jgi:hypothetical protein
MQKRIFALWGFENTGKSTTLKLIAREIMRQFFGATANILLEPLPEGDLTVIITIGGKKIGIATQGDPNTGLFSRLEELVNSGCIIIFCATRTKQGTVDDVEAIENTHQFRVTWLTNYQSGYQDEHPFLSQRSAEGIVQLMRAMCGI